MSRPKLQPKEGDVVFTPGRVLATVRKVTGDIVEVMWFDPYGGYRTERYSAKVLRKVHEPVGVA